VRGVSLISENKPAVLGQATLANGGSARSKEVLLEAANPDKKEEGA
jgi:hypothetical protein